MVRPARGPSYIITDVNQTLIPRVAYFCMEFGLGEDLPVYAGGLGILAGDVIKAAGDLRLPLTGVGIFWSEGYTVQRLTPAGGVVDEHPAVARGALLATGAVVNVRIRGRDVPITAYRVDREGLAPLYLLEPVEEAERWITRRLYGGAGDDRVAQEIVLGVGGVRILRALGIPVDLYHFNEGHAVLAALELLRERTEGGATWEEALRATRAEVVFTTHTPVAAGNEIHRLELLADLGVAPERLAALGGDPFSMTVAGLRLSTTTNAVAELHGATARKMWAHVEDAAPIVAVTNGVHPPTWQDERVRVGYARGALWEAHQQVKRELLALIRARTGQTLREDRLLVGFARRAAAYKRADLIFRDPARLGALLAAQRLQLVFAGKAHPHDGEGKKIIAQLHAAARQHEGSIVFLENYDIGVGQKLTRGCDVWLNTPRRPMEASGTSGMKAAMNGVLNVSVLDGWWPEGCQHGVNGWQIGDGFEGPGQDAHDGRALMDALEGQVIPTYENDRARWTQMMAASIEMSQWRFSSYRMLEDYYDRVYRPAETM
jgi:starch phosphorylase